MKQRERDLWEVQKKVEYDASPEADSFRELAKADFKFFFNKLWLKATPQFEGKTGKVHDFLMDFMRLHELQGMDRRFCHSPLVKYMPSKDKDGCWSETWLYWPTWKDEPTVQLGPEGIVSNMFHNEGQWRGCIVRLAGSGHDKCVLIPRGHLKSTIATAAHSAWQICCQPHLRSIILSENTKLAKKLVGSIKQQFERNEDFQRYFGKLGPPSKAERLMWASTAIQVRLPGFIVKDPTLQAEAVGTEVTGAHADCVKCDDVVGQLNVRTPERRQKVREKVQNLESVRDPGSYFTDIGTIWSSDDAHKEYIRRDGHSYDLTSFMVATVRMEDGSPLWPEVFTERVIRTIEKKQRNEPFFHWCQYYNQPHAAAVRVFQSDWIRHYDEHTDDRIKSATPQTLVKDLKLDIFITCDPASSVHKKSDFSACVVQGLSEADERFILDGFCDRLSPDILPSALADIIVKWQDIAHRCGVGFRFALESQGAWEYLKKDVINELRRRGAACFVEDLKHNYKAKPDRIKVLANPYAMRLVYWPRNLNKQARDGEAYDFIELLRHQYNRFTPNAIGDHDDILDAQAYGEMLMRPVEMKDDAKADEEKELKHGAYSRSDVEFEEEAQERETPRIGRYVEEDGYSSGQGRTRRVYEQMHGRTGRHHSRYSRGMGRNAA